MMNSWFRLEQLMIEGLADLPDVKPLKKTLGLDGVVSLEHRLSEDLDAAIYSFSTSGRWPLIESEECYLLNERIKFGLFLSKCLQSSNHHSTDNKDVAMFPVPKEEDFPLELQIQWALIAAWKKIGRELWARSAFDEE